MTLEEMRRVVTTCEFPMYGIFCLADGRGEFYVQASYMEADTRTGKLERQVTRRWFLSPSMTESEIVQTVFKCILTSAEHRTREWFKYKGEPVFGPHFDVNALVEICRAKRFSDREERNP